MKYIFIFFIYLFFNIVKSIIIQNYYKYLFIQFNCVIIPICDTTPLLRYRNLLYTAIIPLLFNVKTIAPASITITIIVITNTINDIPCFFIYSFLPSFVFSFNFLFVLCIPFCFVYILTFTFFT